MKALSASLSGALFCALPLSIFAQASPLTATRVNPVIALRYE